MSILWFFILIPALSGLTSFFLKNDTVRRSLWGMTAAAHFALTSFALLSGFTFSTDGLIGLDALSLIFLSITSLLFIAVTWYGIAYIAHERVAPVSGSEDEKDKFFQSIPEAIFSGCLLLFLASMTLGILSRNFALQWVAIEATTLSSTPLIYFHRHRRSLEAAWKYLIICSVAIALALLGVFFINVSLPNNVDGFTIDIMLAHANQLNTQWLEIAFIFLLVGYGTKMGLVPMHTWLPDAHSEAPSPVSALLSGALLNCSFLGILRLYQVCEAAGIGFFGRELLVFFGLMSMGLAGVFILQSLDYKRMLAYSSVEHMGILAVGIGLGGNGVFGSLLHAVNHSMVKTMLFLTAGNILISYHTKKIHEVSGLLKSLPITGVLWFAGFLAITGSPPFGTFLSEFTILKSSIVHQRWVVCSLYLMFLTVAFVGMLRPFVNMTFGKSEIIRTREPMTSIIPQIILILLSLFLGIFIPEHFKDILNEAAGYLGGTGL